VVGFLLGPDPGAPFRKKYIKATANIPKRSTRAIYNHIKFSCIVKFSCCSLQQCNLVSAAAISSPIYLRSFRLFSKSSVVPVYAVCKLKLSILIAVSNNCLSSS